MGMLFVLALVVGLGLAGALFVHALRSDRNDEHGHGWLVVVPLLIIFGWVIETLITG